MFGCCPAGDGVAFAADSHCTATKDDRERRPVLPVPIVSIDYLFSVAAAVHPFRVLSTCGSCWGCSAIDGNEEKYKTGEISVSHRITFAQGLTSRRTQSFCHPRTTEGNKLHFISCIAVWLISYTSLAIENPIYLDIVPLVNRREGFKWLHRTFNGAVIKE